MMLQRSRLQAQLVRTHLVRSLGQPKRSVSIDAQSATWTGKVWAKYTEALYKRPLSTKAAAAAFIFFTSDSVTQKIMDPSAAWDPSRAGSGAAFGVVATGWLHYWWGFLETAVGARIPAARYRLGNTVSKVFLDQAIGAPLYIYTYYVITNFLQSMSSLKGQINDPSPLEVLSETHQRAVDMLFPTMLQHWRVWPAVHTMNFYYIPLHHRVMVQNTVLIGWSGYLSHLNNGGLGPTKGELMTPDEEVKVTIKRRETGLI